MGQPGSIEGIARGLSQALTYVFEVHKTSIQVHGRSPVWTPLQWANNLSLGIFQSSLTAGLVFQTYFAVYYSISATQLSALASPLASFVTSGIKIPIGNCMRVVQASPKLAPTIIHAGIAITKNRGIHGLYSGYMLSLIEDIIEMDVRTRLYLVGMHQSRNHEASATQTPIRGFAIGAVAGAVAAAITTPFDTMRAHLAHHAAHTKMKTSNFETFIKLQRQSGGLYRGVRLRALSTGIKTALFYAIVEGLQVASV